MTLESLLLDLREVLEGEDHQLSFGRVAAAASIVVWAAIVGAVALRSGPAAAADSFVETAPQLALLAGSLYGLSRGGDALQGLKGGQGAPHPPKIDKE